MFFSGWGAPSTIQSASMDGANQGTIHSTSLTHPNDIALDIPAQRVYWTNGFQGSIEYSNYDGTNRQTLAQIDSYIFGLTLDPYLIFFSEWGNNSIRYIHKLDDQSPVLVINDELTSSAKGLVLIHPNRQPAGKFGEMSAQPPLGKG